MEVKLWPKIGEPEILAESRQKALIRQWFLDPYKNEPADFSLFGTTKSTRPTIVFPLTMLGEVVAVKQFRPAANQIVLELPGGEPQAQEATQPPSAVGRRELREETGYEPAVMVELAPLVYFEPGFTVVNYFPFLALGCRKVSKQKLDSAEYIEIVTMPLQRWLQMIFAGEIIDSKSMAITLMALPRILHAHRLPTEISLPQLFSL